MVDKRVIIITQARIASSRFPAKVLQPLGNGTLLSIHLERLKKSKYASEIVVATTQETDVEKIITIADDCDTKHFQGSLNDVLDRFYQAARLYKPDYIVRVTSDCPLIDANLLDDVVRMTIENNLDYGTNILKEEYPDGQDIEVFTFSALEKAWQEATISSDREHVTPYIKNNSSFKGGIIFTSQNYDAPQNYNHVRMTIDEPKDLEVVNILINKLGMKKDWKTYADYYLSHPEINELNKTIIRNEGYIKSLQNDQRQV